MPYTLTLTSSQNISGGPTTEHPDSDFVLSQTYDPSLDTTRITFSDYNQTLDDMATGGNNPPGSSPDQKYENSQGQEIGLDQVQTAKVVHGGVDYGEVKIMLGYKSELDWQGGENGSSSTLIVGNFTMFAIWAELTPGDWQIIGYTATGISIREATDLAPGSGATGSPDAPDNLTASKLEGTLDGKVQGTDGDDLIDANYTGDPDGDVIDGGDNTGRFGESGSDDDYIEAGAGNDTVYAGLGNDTVYAGAGDDLVYGGEGDDTIYGGDGNDTLYGGPGNDLFYGGYGNDWMEGGDGDDIITAEYGQDTVYGGAGNDFLFAQYGDHYLDGGEGNDTLSFHGGNSTLTGGEGFDHFYVYNGLDPANDYVLITDFNTGTGQDIHDGDQSNNDFIALHQAGYSYYNLDLYNKLHGTNYKNPLQWMRADQADDGTLNMLDGQNGLPYLNVRLENNGSPVAPEDLTFDNTGVPCFAGSTLIETDHGQCCIEDLRPGNLIQTADNGMQPIRWIGSIKLDARALAANPKLRPIRIRAGALGNGTPSSDLVLSPQHRVLVRSRIAQKMFGATEVLVAARQLLLLDGIDIATDLTEVEYFHMLFDRHEVVISNGALTESLYTGAQALQAVGKAARDEIFTLFPQLGEQGFEPAPARPLPSGRRARKLANRHLQNHRPMMC
ncbi:MULTISPECIES: Hint domain-containing protein [unclassified Paracoccus (in: a-proteobacteria)]|uniref:Hint domain-containing protein n=1 Tax=unclassified Paracoccus (in: a-proteobacteria) TaxID=2688777 RepID=UPI000225F4AA|nr:MULTISPECIES: Hint domain-containing protein [unclassified Paracoccus (in: a-proteobacteria)]SMG55913.1 Hemolysin-type calcium-binding repeat-containing protein [Paracoccus sp. J56]